MISLSPRGAAIACALLVLATACASTSETTAAAPPPPPLVIERDVVVSPLETELGFPSDPARRQYVLATEKRSADETIVRCMADAGFSYTVGFGVDVFLSGAFVGDGSRAWIEVNGLGITPSFAQALSPTTQAQVADPAARNLDYVASLTPEQAAAYDRALVGAPPATDVTGEFSAQGCWAVAYDDLVSTLRIIERFDAELAELDRRFHDDPRVQAFEAQWSECMSEQGYRFATEQAMVDDVYSRLLAVDLASDLVEQTLDELLAYERGVGLAAFACRLPFASDLDTIRADYEQEFLDDNRFVIAELRADPQG